MQRAPDFAYETTRLFTSLAERMTTESALHYARQYDVLFQRHYSIVIYPPRSCLVARRMRMSRFSLETFATRARIPFSHTSHETLNS
jgi:hypothetical protein